MSNNPPFSELIAQRTQRRQSQERFNAAFDGAHVRVLDGISNMHQEMSQQISTPEFMSGLKDALANDTHADFMNNFISQFKKDNLPSMSPSPRNFIDRAADASGLSSEAIFDDTYVAQDWDALKVSLESFPRETILDPLIAKVSHVTSTWNGMDSMAQDLGATFASQEVNGRLSTQDRLAMSMNLLNDYKVPGAGARDQAPALLTNMVREMVIAEDSPEARAELFQELASQGPGRTLRNS